MWKLVQRVAIHPRDSQEEAPFAELRYPVLRTAGRTLRSTTEGAIGSLLAMAATQPTVWQWTHHMLDILWGAFFMLAIAVRMNGKRPARRSTTFDLWKFANPPFSRPRTLSNS